MDPKKTKRGIESENGLEEKRFLFETRSFRFQPVSFSGEKKKKGLENPGPLLSVAEMNADSPSQASKCSKSKTSLVGFQ